LVESFSTGASYRLEFSGARASAGAAFRRPGSWESLSTMKAKIVITPKKAVLDPQGKTVQNALAQMGYTGIGAVHVGKYLEIELTGADKETAQKQINDACHKILSNPVIEDYRFEIE
jgi:phosphoribosylformylglycinamidine synthase subunit PurS